MDKSSNLVVVADSDGPYEVVAFIVERAYLKRDRLLGLPVVPFEPLESA